MAANPTIRAVSASKDSISTLIMALLENSTRGMVQMRAYLSASCVTEDTTMRLIGCLDQSSNIYINEIYQLASLYKPVTTSVSSTCLRAYKCNSGENCDTAACSFWNSSYNSEMNNNPMSGALGNTPISVSNLSAIPGNRSISVSWGDVGQETSIWAYWVILSQGATVMVSGWTQRNNILISNLTNGTPYTVKVKAGSFDGYSGLFTESTVTPVAPPCPIPVITFTIPS